MGLEILAVRGRPANPSELLGSARMRELIEEVAQRYDRVILDTPAALGLPDAKAVADLCDGVVVVVRADVTTPGGRRRRCSRSWIGAGSSAWS